MPWKECSVMDERLQFVGRRLAGEAMAELCREFGISRKTGYKIKEATRPAANFLQQQARFDRFVEVFNHERPHEALDRKCPAEVYPPSPRPYTGLPDIDYPFHDKTIVVTNGGRICLGRKKINFSTVLAGQAVGIKEVHDDIWLVSFMQYDWRYFDLETRVREPLENPFGPKVLPMP
jgi:putative transposase